jgi:hypothetical protein
LRDSAFTSFSDVQAPLDARSSYTSHVTSSCASRRHSTHIAFAQREHTIDWHATCGSGSNTINAPQLGRVHVIECG